MNMSLAGLQDYYSEREEDLEVRFDASQTAWQTGVSCAARPCASGLSKPPK